MRRPPKRAQSPEEFWTRLCLEVAVPLWLNRWREQGLTVDQARAEGLAGGDLIAEHSDLIVRGAKGSGEVFNAIAKAMAALSFHPGGVTLFGARFETDPASWEAKRD
jgi:hypothetical protein